MGNDFIRWLMKLTIVRKAGHFILRFIEIIWNHLPDPVLKSSVVLSLGRSIHKLIKVRDVRDQNPWTYFLRNRAEMDLIHEIISTEPDKSNISILVLACSVGMEVYSIKWRLKDLETKFDFKIWGLELSKDSLQLAMKGEYPLDLYEGHMERLTEKERKEFFIIKNNVAYINPGLKDKTKWLEGDACDPDLVSLLGYQDIVLANRFLCHMYPEDAERCLQNIIKLIKPGGYLFVSGVDLDIRRKIMENSDFDPVSTHLQEVHNGDYTLLRGWPWSYWGLEPLPEKVKYNLSKYAMVYKRKKSR